jgi:hypothetical protein
MKLKISDGLVLGADFVTSTQAILAQKGKGKTHCATVEAEELLDAGQQVIVIDPTDAWYGLRSSPDGRSTGYPIAVFGGEHGDVPLESGGGAVLAEAIVRERFSAIVCTETMTKGEELRFLADFLETLYRKNREALHLFIDEADIIAPQQPLGVDARTCGATDDLVRRGRKKGIGVTLISQRASVLNKNVLSQADMLVALGCSHPLDLGAIDKWVRTNADPKRAAEMMASLPSLPRGEAWVWNPSHSLFKRVTIRQRRTFDSGATPKAGEKKREPKVLAPIDLARLGEAMAAAVQRQKDNDPTELKKQVADLRKTLERVGKGQDRAEANEKASHAESYDLRVEVTKLREQVAAQSALAIKPSDLSRLDKIVARAEAALAKHDVVVSRHHQAYQAALESYTTSSKAAVSAALAAIDYLRAKIHTPPPPATTVASRPQATHQSKVVWSPKPVIPAKVNGSVGPTRNDPDLKPVHLRFLSAIAWWEAIGIPVPDLGGVAFIAGTSTKSSAFDNNRSRLRSAGYIDYPQSGRVQLTEAGRKIAPPPSIPQTNEALHEAVMSKVSPVIGRMLKVLIETYPREVSLEDLAKRAGTSTTSSAFDNNRSWLKARGLAAYPRTGFVRATELLFPEVP